MSEPLWRRYLRFVRPSVRADVDDEFAFHIQTRVDELTATGLSADTARRQALAEMGNVAGAKWECVRIGEHEQRKHRWHDRLEVVGHDLRYGVRGLRRSPAFTTIVIFTLALSIGATTAIFSVVNGVLLKPLRVGDPERLVAIFETNPERGITAQAPSSPNFFDWQAAAHSFSGMAAYRLEAFTLTGVQTPEVLAGAGVTSNLFDVLGVRPILGRGFAKGDDEGEGAHVVVISHGAWQRVFGAAPNVIGRTVIIDRLGYEIIGVMPPGFTYPDKVDAWRASDLRYSAPAAGIASRVKEARPARYLGVVARLAPQTNLAAAEQEMRTIAASLAKTYPDDDGGWSAQVTPMRDAVVHNVEPVLLLALAAVCFVLLIACANVASLALGRAIARDAEMAVRVALGAGRGRLYRQMLTESLVLSVAGGAGGVVLAWAGLRAFVQLAPSTLPRLDEIALDTRVLSFTLILSVATGLVFGLAPCWRVARTALGAVLRQAGRGASAKGANVVRRALVVSEVALATLLLIAAGLTLRSVLRVLAVDPGYTTEHIIAARVTLDGQRYQGNVEKVRYLRELGTRIAAIPGVERVAATSTLPLTKAGIDFDLGYHAEGRPEVAASSAPRVDYRIISPGYIEAMGIRLRTGRAFTDADRLDVDVRTFPDSFVVGPSIGHRVMLVNETFARLNWPGESAVGKHIRLDFVSADPWEVIGVVSDTRHAQLTTPPRPQLFVPIAQAELLFSYMTVIVRTKPNAPDIVPALRAAAVAIDPTEPLFDIDTIETLHAEATARDRLTALVFGAFALLALVLAAAGIYGVIAYQVARRAREIGVRIALGASHRRVARGVVGEAMGMALAGVALGAVAALAGTRLARGMLFEVAPSDPSTFVAVALLLLAVAIAAALVPAARAAGIQPSEALRAE